MKLFESIILIDYIAIPPPQKEAVSYVGNNFYLYSVCI